LGDAPPPLAFIRHSRVAVFCHNLYEEPNELHQFTGNYVHLVRFPNQKADVLHIRDCDLLY
jgi:hypothetical protein